jgi:drug/metabolite transporter (DMT)-like permease
MVVAAFFFSLMSLFVKLAGRRLPVSEIVLFRSLVMVVVSAILVKRAGISPWGNRKPLLLFRGAVGSCALFGFFYAVTKLPLADVTVIHFTNPIYTALLATLLLSEKMRKNEIAGLLLSIAGVVLVVRPSFLFGRLASDLDLFAVSVALLVSVFSAFAYVTIRKLRETEHFMVIVLYFALVSLAAAIPLSVGQFIWPTPGEWALVLCVGVFTQIAQMSLTKGLSLERAGRAMSISYIQVIFAAIWGFLFFGDYLTLPGLAGTALIFVGCLVVATRFKTR